jgi:hypothetical protein
MFEVYIHVKISSIGIPKENINEALQAARKTGVLMLGEYKAHIWLVMADRRPIYRWTVQRIATAESILHSGEKDSFEDAVGEARACLYRLSA